MEEKTEERGRGCMTTLCYIEKDDSYLMMHRTVKKNDVNKDKWIGVGGHAELGESPEECMRREIREETGLKVVKYSYRGLITFVSREGGIIKDLRFEKEQRRSRAFLSRIAESGVQHVLDGEIAVGHRGDDGGVLPAGLRGQ